MSLIVSSVARLKPEIRLAEAVSQFEAILSTEQKIKFRTYRSQALESPPDSTNVMRLTADIDRSQRTGNRCFGPRFTSFLHGVQQFAALGDVIIGGSQNIVACGVWSLVRMSLLAVVNFSSYLESLSLIFMEVGRSAPRHQAMALLYPHSKHLQSQISEYFIVVVRICHRITAFAHKSTLSKITSVNNAGIKADQSELDLWARSIREEMELQTAKRFEEEAQDNSRSRALSARFSKSANHQHRLATKQRILDLCSEYDYETSWKQIRKLGNTRLFQQTTDYQEWKAKSESCTLLYTGKLGSGKSVMLANMIDDLSAHIEGTSAVVTYFFCRHDVPESLDVRTIIGALVRQTLRPIPDFVNFADMIDGHLGCSDMIKILKRALSPGQRLYIVLDGLDLSERAIREEVIEKLCTLQENHSVNLCLSYRLEPDTALGFAPRDLVATRVVSQPENSPDIEEFIEAELEGCLERRALVIGEPMLILDIQKALLRGSQGMFLWVSLQIRLLCTMRTDQQIRESLLDLPRDLSEIYSRILSRLQKSGRSYQRLIFELVLAAQRPLTTDEMREALSVVPGDTHWSNEQLLNHVFSALANCGCLLAIDEEEMTVRLVHHSVKRFLLESYRDSNGDDITTEGVHATMAEIIVTYLNYGAFGTDLARTRSPSVSPQLDAGSILSRMAQSNTGCERALKLLRSKRQPDIDVVKVLAEARGYCQSQAREFSFHFHRYATTKLVHHVLQVTKANANIQKLLPLLLKRQESLIMDGLQKEVKKLLHGEYNRRTSYGGINEEHVIDGANMLHLAAVVPNTTFFNMLLRGARSTWLDAKNRTGNTPFALAAVFGHEEIAALILETGHVDVNTRDNFGTTPLLSAIGARHIDLVKLLIEQKDIQLNRGSKFGNTPLATAVFYDYTIVIKLLLDTGRVDLIEDRLPHGKRPIFIAVQNGNRPALELLLNSGNVWLLVKDIEKLLALAKDKGDAEILDLVKHIPEKPKPW